MHISKNESSLVRAKRTKAVKKAFVTAVFAGCLASLAAVGASAIGITPVTADFKGTAVSTLENVIRWVGAGVGVWGVVNLIEGYGNDNAGAKSQGVKQLAAGVALFGATALAGAIFDAQ